MTKELCHEHIFEDRDLVIAVSAILVTEGLSYLYMYDLCNSGRCHLFLDEAGRDYVKSLVGALQGLTVG